MKLHNNQLYTFPNRIHIKSYSPPQHTNYQTKNRAAERTEEFGAEVFQFGRPISQTEFSHTSH